MSWGLIMPFWLVLVLIVGLSAAIYFVLRPVQVLTRTEFIISHLFIVVGLWLIMGHILLMNADHVEDVSMVVGGIWTLAGGVCFAVVYVSRRLKMKSAAER